MNKQDIRTACMIGLGGVFGYVAARAFMETFFPVPPLNVNQIFTEGVPVDQVERLIQEMARTAPMN